MNDKFDNLHFGGFQSYAIKQLSTSKPGTANYYIKEVYKDISNHNKRKINYLDDKMRSTTQYNTDYIKTDSQNESYNNNKKNNFKNTLMNYEYGHDETIQSIIQEGKIKNEEGIRERYAHSTQGFARKTMFSNWETQNKADNKIVKQNIIKGGYKKTQIPDWFKNKYHPYQTGYFRTEHYDNLGIYGENPQDKFFNKTQRLNKLYSDNFDIAKGTSKATDLLPGYGGYISTNGHKQKGTTIQDPYFNVNKTNHVINYRSEIPRYQGHKPVDATNLKITRPYCLSTKRD